MAATVPLDIEPTYLLRYLSSYKLVVCTSCKYAVQPSAIAGHLNDIHCIHHSRRRPFMQYVSKLDLALPEVVLKTEILEFPVPVLPVQDGLKCGSPGCLYLCASEKRMKTHWYSEHCRPGRPFVDWHPAPLQTFFRGNLLRYFTSSDLSPTDYYCHLTQDLVREPKASEKASTHNITIPSMTKALPYTNTNLDELDRRFLKHYITFTSLTLATDAETKVLWQHTILGLAYEHPFLMHGVLACAGLHLAYLNPAQEPEYSIRSGSHQEIAMPLFRSTIGNADHDTCDAILAFSHLLIIYTWASEKQDERLLLVEADGEDILPPWLYFLRSGCSLLCNVWEYIETGPVKSLAAAWDIPIPAPKSKTHLVNHLLSAIPEQTSLDAWPIKECKIYHDAALELGTAFTSTLLSGNFTTWDALRIFPMYADVEYFALLKTWHPGALIILAHYCILLQRVQMHWYFEGRATRLLSTILNHLDAKWHPYIKWPLDEIRGQSTMT